MPDNFKPNWYPFWSPRFWHGLRSADYFRLLARNRFAIHPTRWPLATTVTMASLFNSAWSLGQRIALGKRIEETEILHPPIFIVGHWRTGTTLMHELLTCDPQFAYPSNYDCFVPHHFMISKLFFARLFGWFLPFRRPMDDMPLNTNSPQEDEFAMCTMGAPSPYLRMAFPNRSPDDMDMLNFDTAPAEKVAVFRTALEFFFKSLTLHNGGRRLVLKSPPHTGRIRRLAEWFPGAKFIHLSRHPYQVVASTLRLWKSLDQVQGFQRPRYTDSYLADFVLTAQQTMYAGYFAQRDVVPASDLIEIRFEELTASPEHEVEKIFERLSLGEIQLEARRNFAAYQTERQNHRPKSSTLDSSLEERVQRHWATYFDAFGYEPVAPQTVAI